MKPLMPGYGIEANDIDETVICASCDREKWVAEMTVFRGRSMCAECRMDAEILMGEVKEGANELSKA